MYRHIYCISTITIPRLTWMQVFVCFHFEDDDNVTAYAADDNCSDFAFVS